MLKLDASRPISSWRSTVDRVGRGPGSAATYGRGLRELLDRPHDAAGDQPRERRGDDRARERDQQQPGVERRRARRCRLRCCARSARRRRCGSATVSTRYGVVVDGDVAEAVPAAVLRESPVASRRSGSAGWPVIDEYDVALRVEDLRDRVGVGERGTAAAGRRSSSASLSPSLGELAGCGVCVNRAERCSRNASVSERSCRLALTCAAYTQPTTTSANVTATTSVQPEAQAHARAQRVADAANGADQPGLAVGFGLAPEVPDVDVERLRRRLELVAPDPLVDRVAGHDDVRR